MARPETETAVTADATLITEALVHGNVIALPQGALVHGVVRDGPATWLVYSFIGAVVNPKPYRVAFVRNGERHTQGVAAVFPGARQRPGDYDTIVGAWTLTELP